MELLASFEGVIVSSGSVSSTGTSFRNHWNVLFGPPSAVQVKLTSELLVLRISDGVIKTLTEATERRRKREREL